MGTGPAGRVLFPVHRAEDVGVDDCVALEGDGHILLEENVAGEGLRSFPVDVVFLEDHGFRLVGHATGPGSLKRLSRYLDKDSVTPHDRDRMGVVLGISRLLQPKKEMKTSRNSNGKSRTLWIRISIWVSGKGRGRHQCKDFPVLH